MTIERCLLLRIKQITSNPFISVTFRWVKILVINSASFPPRVFVIFRYLLRFVPDVLNVILKHLLIKDGTDIKLVDWLDVDRLNI